MGCIDFFNPCRIIMPIVIATIYLEQSLLMVNFIARYIFVLQFGFLTEVVNLQTRVLVIFRFNILCFF